MYEKELQIATQAVKKAEPTFRKYFGTKTQVKKKGGNPLDLVSYADKKIEKEIRDFLFKKFPAYGFIGEESGHFNSNAKLIWTLDPIDGTANYLQGLSYCATSLALLQNGKPVVGVISAPILGLLYTGSYKNGSWLNGTKLNAAKEQEIKNAFGTIGWGRDVQFGVKIIPKILPKIRKLRVPGSAVLSICYVAQGIFDFYVHKRMNIWDYAAGQIIVEEAGGIFLETKKPQIQIAGNKILVPKLLKLLK